MNASPKEKTCRTCTNFHAGWCRRVAWGPLNEYGNAHLGKAAPSDPACANYDHTERNNPEHKPVPGLIK